LARSPTITLTTDFGMSDGYVGIVKGVILSINADARLVDISHDVRSWDIAAGAWVVWNAQRFFPAGTIHLCVVDPAVGSPTQRGVAIVKDGTVFVGPDNGIFSHVLPTQPEDSVACYQLTNKGFWRQEVSSTFHTRDIYGPVCAHLAKGVEPNQLGPLLDPATIHRLPLPEFTESAKMFTGCVVHIDKFGNLITNIPGDAVKKGEQCYIHSSSVGAIGTTYGDVQPGDSTVFIGSHGFVEIGACQASAQAAFRCTVGANVSVERKS
jgi:hypothetical protein